MAKRREIPTSEMVRRAIVLDLEGFKNGELTFAGHQIDGVFEQVVFDRGLEDAARHRGLRVCDAASYLEELLLRCRREQRRLLAFTRREATAIEETLGESPLDIYLDAHKLGRHVARGLGALPRRGQRNLPALARVAGLAPPPNYGRGKTTARILSVRSMLERRGSYAALTGTVKGKWTKVLKHNAFDVEAARFLAIRASMGRTAA